MMIVEQMLNNAQTPLLHIADVSGSALFQGDCLEIMPLIPDNSIDMILIDPPYNTTDCKWDKQPIDWNLLKAEFMRIIKPAGTICISVQNPFSFMIGSLFVETYRHRWIWEKDKSANFQAVKCQPLKTTEDILVFNKVGYKIPWNNNGKQKGVYNPQMREGKGHSREKAMFIDFKKGQSINEIVKRDSYRNSVCQNTNDSAKQRYPKELIYFTVPHKKNERVHPTQKPVELFEYLIKTYTNDDMIILDCFIGSGTTGVASKKLNRKFIGIEKEPKYYEIACQRCGF